MPKYEGETYNNYDRKKESNGYKSHNKNDCIPHF